LIFATVLTAINTKANPPFSGWPLVTLTARHVGIDTSEILMGVTLGTFGSIADKLHKSLS
jgi:hypothetical protein